MPRSPLIRLLQRPGLLAAALFAATIGLAGALAYQAARAAASHRAAAEASLVHHATILEFDGESVRMKKAKARSTT